jgi:hypothetical protein
MPAYIGSLQQSARDANRGPRSILRLTILKGEGYRRV